MIVGTKVKLTNDVVVDKYYHGYTTFPKGSLFTYEGLHQGLSDNKLRNVFSPVDVIETEQPKLVFLDSNEFEVVNGYKTDTRTKELLLTELKNVNPNNCDIKISRNTDYSLLFSKTNPTLKCVIHISITSDYITATISSNDVSSFSIYDKDNAFESNSYSVKCEGLFKEVYNAIKHLLILDL